MRTALQHATTHRLEQARQRAWLDKHARTVGYLDHKLHRYDCPYAVGSPLEPEWRAGYRVAADEKGVA